MGMQKVRFIDTQNWYNMLRNLTSIFLQFVIHDVSADVSKCLSGST
jgi:hypothetical protein